MRNIIKVGFEKICQLAYRITLRSRLHLEGDFTLLAPTCIAGVIYHNLGKQFCSPTINLFMSEDDFFTFISDLERFVSEELKFYKQSVGDTYDFPIGVITVDSSSVYINFNHHTDFSDAKRDWDKRKKRILYDRLYVIASTRGGERREVVERWGSIMGLKGLVCFTKEEYPDVPYAFQLDGNESGEYMMEEKTGILQLRPWERQFDYVKWLNKSVY